MAQEREGVGDKVDVERIVRGIRDEIRRRHPEPDMPAWDAPRSNLADGAGGVRLDSLPGPAIFSPHLRYLNEHWQLDPMFPLRSHRAVVGRVIVAAKKLVRKSVMGLFLPVFQAITAFFSNTTNFLNTLAKNVDDTTNVLAATDRRLAERIENVASERRELVTRIEGGEKALVERMDLLFAALDRERLALERPLEDLEAKSAPAGP
ncbi:MAG: hypothetical protein IPK07_20820 [Deltaproteobacteria bacterium]|nr:hypothetical protein [Deltaproteobacteria bacterium]